MHIELYEVGTLAVDGWAVVTFASARRGLGRTAARSGPLLAVPNVIAHPSTTIAITVLLYNSPYILCGSNMHIKG